MLQEPQDKKCNREPAQGKRRRGRAMAARNRPAAGGGGGGGGALNIDGIP